MRAGGMDGYTGSKMEQGQEGGGLFTSASACLPHAACLRVCLLAVCAPTCLSLYVSNTRACTKRSKS